MDDRNAGICGEKKPGADSVSHYRTERLLEDGRPDLLRSFCDFYAAYDPDLITTASHATERNLEMPFSVGNLRARDGALYADFPEGPEALKESGKRRVFLPIGNCLIGNVNNTRESMAIAWMNSAHASAMAGYVVPTWYGRNGWGGLKYWLTTPGRYSLAEAFYLNQQDMLHQIDTWDPELCRKPFPYGPDGFAEEDLEKASEVAGRELTIDELGFFFDRDVLAFYGDHLPYLGDNQKGYAELGSEVSIPENEREDILCSYKTPYVLWANDAAADTLNWSGWPEATSRRST